MRIAVVGGTGTLGALVVERLATGHEVRVLTRHSATPVDLSDGSGLADALAGCEVVVDASNATRAADATLVAGTARLLAAGRTAGVRHHVGVSIVGCQAVPVGYFRAKAAQEAAVAAGPLPWTVVAATQFHELVAGLFSAAGRVGVAPLLRVPVQSVAADEVASLVADVAAGEPRRRRVTITGPRTDELAELARTWRASGAGRGVPLRVRVPGALGRALRSGALTLDGPDAVGRRTFDDWLPARTEARS